MSPIEQLSLARRDADEQRSRADAFSARAEQLEAEKASLAKDLADANRRLAELEAEVRRSTSHEQELTDALLACEIERAKLERRLLEIRLADLQSGKEGDQ
jgi:chromosome segregation ATPase